MKYLAVLGRLPKLSLAELESLFTEVEPKFSLDFEAGTKRGGDLRKNRNSDAPKLATFYTDEAPIIDRLGGTQKLGVELPEGFNYLIDSLAELPEGKITLGISDFRRGATAFKAQGEALKIKKLLARRGRSVRVLQNKDAVLSTATSHHNQLAEKQNHVEIMLTDFGTFRLTGVQNITEYAKRDQARPARDAKVGMLPPKLAQILINLCGDLPEGARLLDPFCGTGVVLQEAALMGYIPFGTDLSEKMVEYTQENLDWLKKHNPIPEEDQWDLQDRLEEADVRQGDATTTNWDSYFMVDAVAAEAFLGQPMSQPPAEIKMKQEKQHCQEIVLGFLKNLTSQIEARTPVVLAVPAWLRPDGSYLRLNLIDEIEKLGYNHKRFNNLGFSDLLYYREGQVVARDIIVLRKK